MIEKVVSVGLAVDEVMEIKKNRLIPAKPGGQEKRICIVTGIHGDELEGQFVCYEVIRRIREQPAMLAGIVDVYPALNPMGIDSVTRGIPMFDLDMNRIFPGAENGAMSEYVAAKVLQDMGGADACIDLHSSNIFLREIPQVRVSEQTADRLLPLAKLLNTDFIWVYPSATVMESTLAHSLNKAGVPTLAVEMGVGMRITKEYGRQLTDGIFRLMGELGIWLGETGPAREPVISTDHEVVFVNCEVPGIFVPSMESWQRVRLGDLLGEIINPLTGRLEQKVLAPRDGVLFTIREYPVVYTGSLLARILGDKL